MPSGTTFPAFVQLKYERDGTAKSNLLAEVDSITTAAKQRFDRSFGEISQTISKSLSGFSGGQFNLKFDIPGLKQAAVDAEFTKQRLIAVRDAATSLARSTSDTSRETQSYITALRAQVIEAERATQAANAQVTTYTRLQGEIDKTVSANNRLAQSYRESFAEQARAENSAFRSQQAVNSRVSPTLAGSSAINNGAGFGALAGLAQAQDEAEQKANAATAAFQRQQAELQILRAAESGAAEGARLLAAAHGGTALALDHTTKSARESAGAFELLFQAQAARTEVATQGFLNQALGIERTTKSARESAAVFEQLFAAQERNAQATRENAAAANALRQSLDPTLAIQQRFDQELARADQLLKAGAISTREYAAAQALARNNLSASHAALFQVADAAKQGTTANHLLVNSTRSLRLATLQSGQQLQDVAISLYSGQRASVVFAQQLPQLAFALSFLEGSANKTHGRIGRFATLLSGPWGLAVGLAVGVAASFAAKLLGLGEETDKTKEKTRDFIDVLQDGKASFDEIAKAAANYSDQLEKARAVTILSTQAEGEAIATNLQRAISERAALAAVLEKANAQAGRRYNPETGGYTTVGKSAASLLAAEEIAANAKAIEALQKAAGELRIKTADAVAKIASDPQEKLKAGFDVLRNEARKTIKDVDDLAARLANLNRQEEAALKSLSDTSKARRSGVGASRDDALGGATALIKQIFGPGTQITSTLRPGDKGDHGRGRAVDFVPAGGVGKYTTAEVEALLEAAGVDIRYGRGGNKQIFGPDRGAKTAGDHKDHFHVGFNGSPSPEGADKAFAAQAKARERAEEQLAQFGERSAEAIARVNERFNEQPRLIDQAAQATRQLDSIIADLGERKPPDFQNLIADAEAAKGAIRDALVRPFEELERDSQRRIGINKLLASGREDEAEAVEQIWRFEELLGPLAEERKDAVFAIAAAERAASEELERQQELVGAYLDATRSIRSEIEGLLSGDKPNFKRIFKQLQGKILFEQLFGDTFRKLEKSILRESGIEQSVDKLAKDTTRAGDTVLAFADTVNEAIRRIAGGAGSSSRDGLGSIFDGVVSGIGGAANDNAGRGINAGIGLFGAAFARAKGAGGVAGGGFAGGLQPDGSILVPGVRLPKDTVAGMSPDRFRDLQVEAFSKSVFGQSLDKIVKGLSGVVGGAGVGFATGGYAGAAIGALRGIKSLTEGVDGLPNAFGKALGKAADGAATGTAVAGIAKGLFGIKKFSTTGSQIGGAAGAFLPIPGGEIIGAIAGGLIGGLFKKAKTGSATLSVGADGVQVGGTGGNSGSRKKAASGLGDGISDSLNRIAEQLGGSADGPISVSIGIRDKNFRVDTSGGGATKKSKGAIDFGTDQEAAIRFAIADAIKDGVITGITAGAQALLRSGKDIEAQVQKAIDFESVFTRLRAFKDPVGAALDVLDKEFSRLNRIFIEAGASTAEFAQLEELYGVERKEAVKQAFESISGSLRSLLNDLTINNDALSLTDRKGFAQARFDPLAARVRGGDVTAFDDFSEAARALLEIERQISGSQGGFFALNDEVKGITQAALDATTALADAASGRDSPLSKSGVPTNDNQGVIDAIGTSNDLLNALNQNMGILIQQGQLNQSIAVAGRGYF